MNLLQTRIPVRRGKRGFTLVEFLTVLTIILILGAAANSALQSLGRAGTVDKAISDLSQTVDLARAYAMANHTYVRIVFSPVPAGTAGSSVPSTLVLAISPADGELDDVNDKTNMADATKWPAISRLLILSNLSVNDALNTTLPDTTADVLPSQSNMVSSTLAFTRQVAAVSPAPTFTSCIQVNPAGEIQVTEGTPARYIKLAFAKPTPQADLNPFILRVSGINGQIDILRKENGIQ